MIQHGLVEGELDTRAEFFRHNRELLANLEKLAAKTRQRELIVEPHVLYRFFDARLPADVCDGPRLEKWRREAERKQPRAAVPERSRCARRPKRQPAASKPFPTSCRSTGSSCRWTTALSRAPSGTASR